MPEHERAPKPLGLSLGLLESLTGAEPEDARVCILKQEAYMALAPCSFGKHRFPGKAATAYPALLDRAEQLRWRLKLCPQHAAVVQDALAPFEIHYDDDSSDSPSRRHPCLTCGAPTEIGEKNIYVTAYWVGDERRDYWATLHNGCGHPGFLPYQGQ